MFESLKKRFRRKNYASPYYGNSNKALSPMPVQLNESHQEDEQAKPHPVKQDSGEPDWEQRRFELVKMLVAQDRRSVVLGKLNATNKQIAANARHLADVAVKELRTHPLKDIDDEKGRHRPYEQESE